jgi:hypothetical protein
MNNHYYLYLVLLILSLACTAQPANCPEIAVPTTTIAPATDSIVPRSLLPNLAALSTVPPTQSYQQTRRKIAQQKEHWQAQPLPLDSISQLFETALVHQIIPYWAGTPWTFEGHSSTPHTGSIACGYFVSTTLKAIGLNLNRYHLAQQSPINEAKSLALSTPVIFIEEASTAANIAAINAHLKAGIHFIGFDQSHVGYVYKKDGALYLIHSNYLDAVGVELEPIAQSAVFDSYSRFYLAELSTNHALLEYWKNGTVVSIVRE